VVEVLAEWVVEDLEEDLPVALEETVYVKTVGIENPTN
jgi:hypothetical protein